MILFHLFCFLHLFNELQSQIPNIGSVLIQAGSKLSIIGTLRDSFLTPGKGEIRISYDGSCGLWGCYLTQTWS